MRGAPTRFCLVLEQCRALIGEYLCHPGAGDRYPRQGGSISAVNMAMTPMISAPTLQVHYIGDVNYYLESRQVFSTLSRRLIIPRRIAAAGGHRRRHRQQESISFSDPVATVSAKDKKGTIAISQLHISGTTSIQLIPMGCVCSNNLSFSMGSQCQ